MSSTWRALRGAAPLTADYWAGGNLSAKVPGEGGMGRRRGRGKKGKGRREGKMMGEEDRGGVGRREKERKGERKEGRKNDRKGR